MPWVGGATRVGGPGRADSFIPPLEAPGAGGTWLCPACPQSKGVEPHPVPARWGGQGDPEGQVLVYRLRGRRAAPLGAGSTS